MSEAVSKDERAKFIKHIELLQEENAFMKKVLKHVFPEKTDAYYLCGEHGDKNELGLPEEVMICPAYGKQELVKYKRQEENLDD
jgi:hypothetical protein